MLKTVSSITNAIGALNYKGTWDANANVPPLASGVGTKGDYYVVGTAGSTTLDGISNWGIGDWAVFNGSVWQRVEGGANLNGVDLSVSGTSTLSGLTASTALALNASKQVVSVTNTGTGNNVLATTPTLVGDVTMSTGNIIPTTAAKGVNFTANTPAAGMTSQLLNWYEEGTWTPSLAINTPGDLSVTYSTQTGYYTKIGRLVNVSFQIVTSAFTHTTASGAWRVAGVPFLAASNTLYVNGTIAAFQGITKANYTTFGSTTSTGTAQFLLYASGSAQGLDNVNAADIPSGGSVLLYGSFTYIV
jgi:hypothetical protein